MKIKDKIPIIMVITGALYFTNLVINRAIYDTEDRKIKTSSEYFEFIKNNEELHTSIDMADKYRDFIKENKIPDLEAKINSLGKLDFELRKGLREQYRKSQRYYDRAFNPLLYFKKE